VEARYSQLAGEIQTDLRMRAFAGQLAKAGVRGEVRESSHYVGGNYVRVYAGADFTFERVAAGEYLARGDAESEGQMFEAASRVSKALIDLGIRHRFEVYDAQSRLIHYLHYLWPEEPNK
jgi:hypothetical protein